MTLLAAAVSDDVGMIAQHNLHHGHVTRAVFQMLSQRPSFFEYAEGHDRFEPLIAAEREALRAKNPNRPLDHTSLGVMLTDTVQKRFIAGALQGQVMWILNRRKTPSNSGEAIVSGVVRA